MHVHGLFEDIESGFTSAVKGAASLVTTVPSQAAALFASFGSPPTGTQVLNMGTGAIVPQATSPTAMPSVADLLAMGSGAKVPQANAPAGQVSSGLNILSLFASPQLSPASPQPIYNAPPTPLPATPPGPPPWLFPVVLSGVALWAFTRKKAR